MRISDWSSDVCSSDLIARGRSFGPIAINATKAMIAIPDHPISNMAAPHRRRENASRHRSVGLSRWQPRSEEHTSELQSLMRISYAVFCLKKKKQTRN